MSDKPELNNHVTFRLIPFTGVIFAVWALFSPESYGRWLGQIVRAFRLAAGF